MQTLQHRRQLKIIFLRTTPANSKKVRLIVNSFYADRTYQHTERSSFVPGHRYRPNIHRNWCSCQTFGPFRVDRLYLVLNSASLPGH